MTVFHRVPAWPAFALPLLLLLALAAFWPALTGPFVFDDFPNLQNLEQLNAGVDRSSLGRYVAAFPDNPGRPLSALSFLIEDAAWPTDPAPFKRNNLLLHLLAGVLVFTLVRRLARMQPRLETAADLIAVATAAAWLLHPIQLSATMLVVQRMNILSTIFMLAGLLAYLASLRLDRLPPSGRVVLAGASLGVFGVLAFLCKENGVLVFAYACAINLTLLRPQIAQLPAHSRRLLQWGAAAPIIALALVALIKIQTIAAGYAGRNFTLSERLMTQSRILVDYLRQILLPRVGGQGIFHDDYAISHGLLQPGTTLACILLLGALAVMAWRLRARVPVLAFAVFWFFAGHLIESTVISLELYFEHRNYMPMVGPLFALAATVTTIQAPYRPLAWTLFVAWLAMSAAMTRYNANTWGDRGQLAGVWLHENPDSVRSIQFKAAYDFDRGDTDAAKRTLAHGFALRPEAGELAFQSALANCLTDGFAPEEHRRIEQIARTVHFVRVIPEIVRSFRKQALDGQCKGTFGEAEFERLVRALMQNPRYSRDRNTMSFLYYELSKLPLRHRNLDQLMRYLDKSYAYRPNPAIPREQAIYLMTAGIPDEALRYLDLSDNTPQPAFKQWLTNDKATNVPLRETAERMRQGGEARR